MEISKINGSMTYNGEELIGRRNRQILNKKVKFKKLATKVLHLINIYLKYIMFFTILVLLSIILIDVIEERNLIVNLENDINIPNYVVKKVIDYLN